MRIALVVEYDGSGYYGWQIQPNLKTVQGTLEAALSQVANTDIRVIYSGRTDTGVHATYQVVHFDAPDERNIRAWIHGCNALLPKDMCVRFGHEVEEDFNARYSATSRKYRYVIYNAPIRPAILQSKVTWQYRQLDAERMQDASACLLGEHDFSSFRAVQCNAKSPIRKIESLSVTRKDNMVFLDIKANAFLHHMVRNIAGVLMKVGHGAKPVAWVQEVLDAKDRQLGAETAPPYGLYLTGVTYPEKYNMPRLKPSPWFLGG